ncbi:MAG: undecaprenyl-phosphate glucose phosphotransferase [Nitrospinota bacterium]|nr:undecaprenyl-phosphate glucose phosphotransferase [Nitrospinota bacterium]
MLEQSRLDGNGSRQMISGMQSHQMNGLFWLQIIFDGLLSVMMLYALTVRSQIDFSFPYRIMAAVMFPILLLCYSNFRIYHDSNDAAAFFVKLFKAWMAVVVFLIAIAFVTKTSAIYSREVILLWIVSSFILQFTAHYAVSKFLSGFHEMFSFKERAILVGAGELGKRLSEKINGNKWINSEIVAVVDDDEYRCADWNNDAVPLVGGLDSLKHCIENLGVSSVYIALPLTSLSQIERLYFDLLASNVNIKWVPDLLGMTLINPNVKELGGMPVFALSELPLNGLQGAIKKMFDVIMALAALVILCPVMLLTALAIKIMMPGSVLFKQRRHGWNGKVFNVYKFRSMVVHDEREGEVTQATADDKRVTWLGRILRKSSIDELPQLFNVIRGEMSLVGPRPHATEHNDYYSKRIDAYMARHRIKPGITGLAQVNGYRGRTETLEKMKRRVELDLEYINSWSLALDVKILIRTVFVLWSKEAY